VALPDGGLWRMPSVATAVVDPTGAGDAFCGGLATGLAGGLDVVEAARRASASAAFAVAGSGSLRFGELGAPPALPDVTRVPVSPASDGRSIGVMAGEIESIPRVISDQLERLDEPLAALVNELEERAVEHVYLTGCGDSAFAGQATALCFSRYAGLDARAVHALDLARYESLPERSAIVCVSYSGKVGRTIEAARRGFSIALTGGPDTPLAGHCDRVLAMSVPTRGLSPGTSTYVAMVTALADFALHWSRGGRESLLRAPELARATLEACWEPARALGRRLAGQRWICVMGGGPNEASARFGAAKFLEGPQVLGTATNVEEWAHEEYFVTRPGTPVIVVAPSGSVEDRVADALEELAGIGADPVLVSDAEPPDGVTWLPLAPGLPEELSPLLAALPLSVVAFSLAEVTGKRSYNFASPEAEARHYRTIHAVGAAV
jgi:glucosamine--fructose-6-phosphate aminotransferase (isomerizing)